MFTKTYFKYSEDIILDMSVIKYLIFTNFLPTLKGWNTSFLPNYLILKLHSLISFISASGKYLTQLHIYVLLPSVFTIVKDMLFNTVTYFLRKSVLAIFWRVLNYLQVSAFLKWSVWGQLTVMIAVLCTQHYHITYSYFPLYIKISFL